MAYMILMGARINLELMEKESSNHTKYYSFNFRNGIMNSGISIGPGRAALRVDVPSKHYSLGKFEKLEDYHYGEVFSSLIAWDDSNVYAPRVCLN